ncbi:MAG: flippase-like domain-containing protein [Myxococcales bacterium]|nr:flippase-like domain-containing protein [Myxococcales bacterium]
MADRLADRLEATPASASPLRTVLRRSLPFVVSAAIVYYYLRGMDWTALLVIAGRVELPLALAAVAVPQLLNWLIGALLVQRTLLWFHGPFSLRDYFWFRGATYILAFINSALGGGGQVLYQQRTAAISWTKLLGILLFRVGLGLWGITLVMIGATLALHAMGIAQRVQLNLQLWWGLLIFGLAWLVEAWIHWHHDRPFGLSRLVVRDREHEFWTAFRLATPRHWLLTWALTLPQLFATVIGYYFLNLAFGIDAPLAESLVVLPLAMLIMDLPVAFAGFGMATVGWMTFFGDYASAEDITALTLFLPMARMLCRAAIGVLSLKPALPQIERLLSSLKTPPRTP